MFIQGWETYILDVFICNKQYHLNIDYLSISKFLLWCNFSEESSLTKFDNRDYQSGMLSYATLFSNTGKVKQRKIG
jgi:hypothetical protein